MSDTGDETIGADPDELASLIEQAAQRQASEVDQDSEGSDGSVDADDDDLTAALPDLRAEDLIASEVDQDSDGSDGSVDADDDDLTAALPDLRAEDLIASASGDEDRVAEEPTVPLSDSGEASPNGEPDDADVEPASKPLADIDEPDDHEPDDLTYATVDEVALAQPRVASSETGTAKGTVGGRSSTQASETAAADFVRESRERAAAVAAEEEKANAPKKRRSGVWVAIAVILGAQIIAGGLYLALSALRDDPVPDEELVEEVATDDAVIEVPTPGPSPTPAPTPVIQGTPTPVPPTPTWRPVVNGPRSAPFTFTVEAKVTDPRFFESRDGDQFEPGLRGRALPLTNPLASGQPLTLRVVGGEPGDEWAQVVLPGDADMLAWIRADEDFVWDSTTRLIQIDVSTNTLTVFEENVAIFEASVATGARGGPSPQVSTYVIEEIGSLGEDVERRLRFANFGGRAADSDGLGRYGIEQARDSAALTTEAGYTTDGRILMVPNDFAQVADLVAPGAKVEVVGTPTAPTPTPVPDSPSTGGSGPGSGFGCPPATLGSPPNCYRLVDRLTTPGVCAGRQVIIEGDCLIFGGDPVLDDFGSSCPSNSPVEISGRCYVRIGPVPEVPAGCPPGSDDFGDECREPA